MKPYSAAKNTLKKIASRFAATAILFSQACESIDVTVINNPNTGSPEQATADFLLNNIQITTAKLHSGSEGSRANGWAQFGMEPVRIQQGYGATYSELYNPTDFNQLWSDAYAGALIDIKTMNALAREAGQLTHIAIGQIIEAYIITHLVDLFGDIPYTEALRGKELIFNVKPDDAASIYAAADQLLIDAIANLEASETTLPENDLYYPISAADTRTDEEQWIKAANTLRLAMALRTRLVNPQAAATINSLVASGRLILNYQDDLQFQWSTNNSAPDSRHPYFSANYGGSGPDADYYNANYFMNLMANQYSNPDPRTRYYFYRQEKDFSTANITTKNCVAEASPPLWWEGFTVYCLVPNTNGMNGLWGRNHLDDEPIPPDAHLRTLHGVYPIGGPFDANEFRNVSGLSAPTEGLSGAGISPILLAANTHLMLAEATLELGTSGSARTHLENGVRESMEKVVNFGAPLATGTGFEATSTTINDHIAEILEAFDTGTQTDKLRIIAEQLFIANWCNGMEPYNTYRRTGQPDNLTPAAKSKNPGNFLRSMWYPQVAVANNIHITQKAAPETRIFWDSNPIEGFID